MFTENKIRIRGTPEQVRLWVLNIASWPRFFPHYRFVTVHERRGKQTVATMAARHRGLPLRWTSILHDVGGVSPQPLATFRHIRGITKGMEVEWHVIPLDEKYTEVRILHRLSWPRGTRWAAQKIVGDIFVRGVASKTLAMVKYYVESKVFPS